MPKELRCETCGGYLGEIEKGKLRLRSVLLCGDCWKKAESAARVGRMAADMPDVVKDLFGHFGKEPG